MGELVDELESLGYVVRRPDPRDRRAKLIVLARTCKACVEAGRSTSWMSAAGLAVPAVLQPDGPVAERGAGDQVEPVGLGDVVVEQPGALARNVGVQVAAELID